MVPISGIVGALGRGLLKNYTLSEITRKMAHSPPSVNRYLEDFLVVALLHRVFYLLLTIRKITKLSERLISEFIGLIERAESEGYKDRLSQLLDPFKVNEPLKNDGGGGSAMTDKGLVKREYAKKYTDRFKGEHCEMCS